MDKLILGMFVLSYLGLFIYYECYKGFMKKVLELFWPETGEKSSKSTEDKPGTPWKIVSSSVKPRKTKKPKATPPPKKTRKPKKTQQPKATNRPS